MRHRHVMIWAGCLLAILMTGQGGLAIEPAALLPIDPVPLTEISDWVEPATEDAVMHQGFIDRINDECFVILDMCRGFAPNVVFRTRPGGPATSRAAFRPGDYVGYRFNLSHKIEAIWLETVPADLR